MNKKLINLETYTSWKSLIRDNKRLVLTNGCFDIITTGHCLYLKEAKKLGDILVVGLNSDSSVKQLKGEKRPINGEKDRAIVISALECVDFVCIYSDKNACNLINLVRPDIYCKAGDYDIQTMNQEERKILEELGCKIHFCQFVDGKSTTNIIKKILEKV